MKKVTLFILPFITLLFAISVCVLLSNRYLSNGEIPLQDITASDGFRSSEAPITAEGKININTATSDELILLSGIGEVLAQRIIDYREENGPFPHVKDLLNVKGIGEAKLNKIIDYIVAE